MDFCRLDKSETHSLSSAWKQHLMQDVFRAVGYFRKNRLDKLSENIQKAQDDLLVKIIRMQEDTEYGKDFNFKSIKSRKDFVEKHPVTNYSHYEKYVEKIIEGQKNVMTSKKIEQLGSTSGTTGKSKLIPTTKDIFAPVFMDGLAMSLYQLYAKNPQLRHIQKTLRFSYYVKPRFTESGLRIGPASSGSPKATKALLPLYTTPLPAYDITTEAEATYVYLLFALKERKLGIIEANFASMVYAGFKLLEREWKKLVEDIRLGRLDPDLQIPGEIRNSLEKLLKADPKRAEELEEVFQSGFDGIALKLWPKLKMVTCTTTGSMEVYARILKTHYCKGLLHFSPFYGSTEGLFAVNIFPDEDRTKYVMVPDSIFLEFIPQDLAEEENPRTVVAEDLQVDRDYELVVTNPSGLYRYRIGDVVRVVGKYNTAPIFEFLYRQGQLLNVQAEKYPESNFYRGLQAAVSSWASGSLVDYTTTEGILLEEIENSSKDTTPYYVIFLELSWSGNSGQTILNEAEKSEVDKCLRAAHQYYDDYRDQGRIGVPRVFQVKSGTFQKLREFLLENSMASPNQFKVPRVIRRKDAVEFLIKNSFQ